MPLSCPVATASQRELHKDSGGGGGGVAGRARAARAPKANSCATSCGTSSAAPCAASFTCSSFLCHLRQAYGGARVRVAARRRIPFFVAFAASFTCPPFTSRPPLSLGLPHQQRASSVQRALGATTKAPLMKKPWGAWGWGAVGAGHGRWRYACVRGGRATGRGAGIGFWGPGGARPHRHATTAAAAVFVQIALRWGSNWAAQWHLARAVGRRFRGCRAKRLYVHLSAVSFCLLRSRRARW